MMTAEQWNVLLIGVNYVNNAVKYTVFCLCAYYLLVKSLPSSPGKKRFMRGLAALTVLGMGIGLLKFVIRPMHLLLLLTGYVLINRLSFDNDRRHTVSLAILTFGCSCAAYMMSAVLNLLIFCVVDQVVLTDMIYISVGYNELWQLSPERQIIWRTLDLFGSACAQALHITLIARAAHMKRLKKGLYMVYQSGPGRVGIVLSLLMVGAITAVVCSGFLADVVWEEAYNYITMFIVLFGLVCAVLLVFWIRTRITAAYRQRVRQNEERFLEESLREKDREISMLHADNERLAAMIRRDEALIPAMVSSVRRLIQTPDDEAESVAVMEAAAQMEQFYAERAAAVWAYEMHGQPLARTGVTSTDAVLSYMNQKADEQGVVLTLTLDDAQKNVSDECPDRREFNTMLADLTENAIISAKASADKRVLVRIDAGASGQWLEVCDSGAPFDNDVLRGMGRRRITTHACEGGSGIGLMTLFEILRRREGSLLIEEYSSGAAYTKRVEVCFDGRGGRKLISPRARELKRLLPSGRFEIVDPA